MKSLTSVGLVQACPNDGTHTPVIIKYPLPFSVSYVQLVTQQYELFEKHLCNKSSHHEKYRRFLFTQSKPSHAITKLMHFTVSKDKWNTKEDIGKSLQNRAAMNVI